LRVLNLSCLNWMQMQQFFWILCWLCIYSHLLCKSRQWFSCRYLQSSMNLVQFSVYHLCSAFSLGHFSACLRPAWIRTQVICMCVCHAWQQLALSTVVPLRVCNLFLLESNTWICD
jgi:hypothetical protein